MQISKTLAILITNGEPLRISRDSQTALDTLGFIVVTDWNTDSNDINGTCSISGHADCCVTIEVNQ